MRENVKLRRLSNGDGVRHNRPVMFTGADDSWQPSGSRSFLFGEPRAITHCAPLGDGWERCASTSANRTNGTANPSTKPSSRCFSGATVLRGVGGYGGSSIYHTDKLLRLSQDLPIILEVIESMERIEKILPRVDEMVEGGLITLERVRVILYRAAKK
jgi:PII-like signaling protein